MSLLNAEIPASTAEETENHEVSLAAGEVLFLVGRNGAGKSALLHYLCKNVPIDKLLHVAALRQTTFQSARAELTSSAYRSLKETNSQGVKSGDARTVDTVTSNWSNMLLWGLVEAGNALAHRTHKMALQGDGESVVKFARETPTPVARLNEALRIAGMTVEVVFNELTHEFLAKHPDTDPFSLSSLSDGERAAIQVAVAIQTAPEGSVLAIDEPERHLHRAISVPLLKALIEERNTDCAVVVATHDTDLVDAFSDANVLLVRGCSQWAAKAPRAWDVQPWNGGDGIPEDLRRAVLGARRNLLFVEGNANSLDVHLYSCFFHDVTIVPVKTSKDVMRAVEGLRASEERHDIKAYGIIDRDDRSDADIAKLEAKHITALGARYIEALYYSRPCAERLSELVQEFLADDVEGYEAGAKKALEHLKTSRGLVDKLASQKTEAVVRASVFARLPSWRDIQKEPSMAIVQTVYGHFLNAKQELEELIEAGDFMEINARYPLRGTGTLINLAKALGFNTEVDYFSSVQRWVQRDTELAQQLLPFLGKTTEWLDLRDGLDATAVH